MTSAAPLRDPWLIAAWSGMGLVGYLAASQLIETLEVEKVDELPNDGWFDVEGVKVTGGLVDPITRPENVLYVARTSGPRDYVIFVGDEQPSQRGFAYAEMLLDRVAEYRVQRVVSFASMASPMAPTAPSRVFAVASRLALLDELGDDVGLLEEGEIKGMNGLLIGAASARAIPAICLMGEFPFFAQAIPNPKAASAVLQAFSTMSGFDLDTAGLDARGRQVERELGKLLEQLQSAASAQLGQVQQPPEEEFSVADIDDGEGPGDTDKLTPEERAHVERLFEAAETDRAKALGLKAELDRLGVFRHFENRFLDLFKSGG